MKTPTMLAQLCAVAVLVAPLALRGSVNEEMIKELGLTRFEEPEFPDAARLDGLATGHVTMVVSRNQQGVPVDILVLEASHPRMAAAAVEAVREWRFTPSGNPADLTARTIRIGFKMQGVVIFPFGKDFQEAPNAELKAVKLVEPVKVPRVQSLPGNPKAIVRPMPAYPVKLAPQKIEGTAAVRFYVDEEGRVRLPEIIEATTPEFAEAALAAVSQWRYEPPQLRGRRIVATDNWEFKFAANN